jgi:hypothetical protein
MQFNSTPASTLFAKVSVKKRPYSEEKVAFQIIASFNPEVKVNNATYYVELPLDSTTLDTLEFAIAKLQVQSNAQYVDVRYAKPVFTALVA